LNLEIENPLVEIFEKMTHQNLKQQALIKTYIFCFQMHLIFAEAN
jgi:hypothetical protein